MSKLPDAALLHRLVLESFDIDIAIFDRECRYQYVNPHAIADEAVRAWVIGKTDAEYCAFRGRDPSIGERRMQVISEVLATAKSHSFEEELPGPDGMLQHFLRRITPVLDAHGDVVAAIGYGVDLTGLRQAERLAEQHDDERQEALRALQESEARFRLVSRATNDVIWDWDLRTNSLWWNEAVTTAFGLSIVDLGLTLDGWLSNVHPADVERIKGSLDAAIRAGHTSWQGEYRFRRADGTYATVLDRGYVLYDEDNVPVRMIGSMLDITQRQVLEAQLRQAQKMEAVGQLAAGVAHDFNNILTAISAYAELVLQVLPADSPVLEDVKEIQRAGQRATGLTRQLLSFTRREIVQDELLDLNQVVHETQRMLQRTIGEQIDVQVRLCPTPCQVRGDRGQLGQVLMNLVINARDAMRETGGILTLETALRPVADIAAHVHNPTAESYVELRVRDTGPGMSEELLSHIFEPFFTTKAMGEGSGLGLATVYGIVSNSGGFVRAESIPGKGAVFVVLLPYSGDAAAATTVPSATVKAPAPLSTILLVEDEAAVRHSIMRMLRQRKFDVLAAGDAVEALEIWSQHASAIAAVISDVVMPGMRGPDLVERLRRDRPALGVIYVSGYTDDELSAPHLSVPRTAFLPKPFAFEDLARALQRVM